MPAPTAPVAIVGGGVIGAACAHYLARAGRRVTVFDAGRFGAACSHGNCGLLTPSHVLPPAEPGVFGEALRGMFRRDAPLRLAPRFDPGLWRWMADFARRCNGPAALAAGRGIRPLLASSRMLYDTLAGRELDCEFAPRGLLFAFRSAAAFEAFGRTNDLLAKHFDAAARRLDAAELAAFEPALRPGLAGGWFYESDAHLRPDALMRSWRASLERDGVELREGVTVTGVASEDGRVTAVRTGDGRRARLRGGDCGRGTGPAVPVGTGVPGAGGAGEGVLARAEPRGPRDRGGRRPAGAAAVAGGAGRRHPAPRRVDPGRGPVRPGGAAGQRDGVRRLRRQRPPEAAGPADRRGGAVPRPPAGPAGGRRPRTAGPAGGR